MVKAKIKPIRHKKPLSAKHPTHDTQISNIAIGTAAACLVGAIAAGVIISNNKKKASKWDRFYDVITNSEDYVHDAIDKGHETVDSIRETASNFFDNHKEGSSKNLFLGLVGAGLLGASAIYLIGQKDHDELNGNSFYGFNVNKWKDIGQTVFDAVSEKIHHDSKSQKRDQGPVQHVMDWAYVGLNLWNEFQKRR
jgi:hypothetical protein